MLLIRLLLVLLVLLVLLAGLYAFRFAVGMALPHPGIAPSFIMALACALAVQAATLFLRYPLLPANWRRLLGAIAGSRDAFRDQRGQA